MQTTDLLLAHNRDWVAHQLAQDPGYFVRLRDGQDPRVLYIGCSDSRVPPEAIMGAGLGDLFVERNIGNLVKADDAALMSALEYGILHLQIEHVIVCGHYGCGAVSAALSEGHVEVHLDRWIQEIRDLHASHRELLDAIEPASDRLRTMEALNVVQQAIEVNQLELVQAARARTGRPEVHAWMFHIPDGRLLNLGRLVDLRRPLAVDAALLQRIGGLHRSHDLLDGGVDSEPGTRIGFER